MLSANMTWDDKNARLFATTRAKALRTAMFRVTDAVAALHVNNAIKNVQSANMPRWFRDRDLALVKQLRKTKRRFRTRVEGAGQIEGSAGGTRYVASFGFRNPTGRALEVGGEYKQYVNEYERKHASKLDRAVATVLGRSRGIASGKVHVKAHLRTRRERAQRYVERSFDQTRPVAQVPLERMTDYVLRTGEVPKLAQLIQGLPGATSR